MFYNLIKNITLSIDDRNHQTDIFATTDIRSPKISAVLFILTSHRKKNNEISGPCLILNKRSLKVSQPGDLCCPGGSISTPFDTYMKKIMLLPGTPLTRWPFWRKWLKDREQEANKLALLLSTALREGLEEMRLNPLFVKFLGPLPAQRLVMFNRRIFPMACWVSHQKKFWPNWEVDKLVYIPIEKLLNKSNYMRYRLKIEHSNKNDITQEVQDFPCFIHKTVHEKELLWGATFRIVMDFLDIVFGFKHPAMNSLPVVLGTLNNNYLKGYDR